MKPHGRAATAVLAGGVQYAQSERIRDRLHRGSSEDVFLSATVAVRDTYTDLANDRSLNPKLYRRLSRWSGGAVGYEYLWHGNGRETGRGLLRVRP